jgi:glycolate oxidase
MRRPARISPNLQQLAERLRARIGTDKVLTDPAQLRTYECDGLTTIRARPGIVVLASHRDDVVETVRSCHLAGVPFVARGSGTGLSGGAVPVVEGVLIVLSRLRQIVSVDPDNARIVVEPGVINLWVTREAAPHRQAYAPDPSSQQVCSIGGNVAENAGGAHCLKYGFTVNHVMGAEVVLPDGEVVHLGGTAPERPGYDLLGAFVGSEGTLGVATQVTVRTIQVPESVRTMLVGFRSVEDAAGTVSDIIAAGILPAAIEMMDALAIEAAEAAVRCGYPAGAVAVLVIERTRLQVATTLARMGERMPVAHTVQIRDASIRGVPVDRLLARALDGPGTVLASAGPTNAARSRPRAVGPTRPHPRKDVA